MSEQQPPDEQAPEEQRRKRRRWRVHLDSVKAEWPVSGGLTLGGTGFLGALLVVLLWWVFHHQSQVEIPAPVGTAIPSSSSTPSPEAQLPLPSPEAQLPLPSPEAQLPLPSPEAQLPLPSPEAQLPLPSPEAQLPLPSPEAQLPSPEAQLPLPAPAPRPVRVPSVVGYGLVSAQQILARSGLGIGSVTQEESSQRAAGAVLQTSPMAGTVVQPGSRVNVVIAKAPAPRPVRVPSVVGYGLVSAQQILARSGLGIGSVTQEESSQRAAGAVLQTSPMAGTVVQPGSRVNVVIAKAPVLR